MTSTKFNILYWIVMRLPKTLVYICGINIVAEATTGKYSETNVSYLLATEAIERYRIKHGVDQ